MGHPPIHLAGAAICREVLIAYTQADAPDSLQLLPPGQSKATGVQRLLKQLGVNAANMMAIGDSESDVEILNMAGKCFVDCLLLMLPCSYCLWRLLVRLVWLSPRRILVAAPSALQHEVADWIPGCLGYRCAENC